MELTGMRWRTDGAQAMLDLRSVFLNGDWDAFQQHRIEENNRHCSMDIYILCSLSFPKAR
jgi:hypothetical protein